MIPELRNQRWEILAGAVLTQNTAWSNVEQALERLRAADITSPEKVAQAETPVLAEAIRPSGYYNQKARKLQILAQACLDAGWLPQQQPEEPSRTSSPTRHELLALWGIGPETADCILLYGFGIPVFVIDAYTRRICSRIFAEHPPEDMPQTDTASYTDMQRWFTDQLPRDIVLYNEYHAVLVSHAANYCRARPLCAECPIGPQGSHYCPGYPAPRRDHEITQ